MTDPITAWVVDKVVEILIDPISNFISNAITVVRKCNENVENLKNQVEKLKDEKTRLEKLKDEKTRLEVQTWLTKAEEFIKEAEEPVRVGDEFATKAWFFWLFPNPFPIYKLSKEAEKMSQDIGQHLEVASRFGPFSPSVAAAVEGFEEFRSRMDVLKQIMEALRNPIVNKIGVYGTSGVGKTMLVKMVKAKAKQDSLFTAVVMATVTKDRDLKSIQEDIARDLGLDQLSFRDHTDRQVADLIKAELMKKKKFLVILDDVWDTEIDFEKFGIPSATEICSSGQEDVLCKILLTSRFHDVLSVIMDEKDQVFEVHKLEDDEAWDLFKNTAGSKVESSDLQPTAKEIVNRCLGLPVAIVSVGKAMKRKARQHEWKTALMELKKPTPEGISAAVHKPIELSYKYLQGDELKQTFMLCSLLGHDSSINDLLKYGMGLNLFPKVKTVEDTRNYVLTLVDSLKLSSLLVGGHSNMHFGMHDQIREVALSIASRDHGVLALVDEDGGKDWPGKETMAILKWIYLSNGYPELKRNELKCPLLTFFHLSNKGCSLEVRTDLFTETEGLKVLCLIKIDFQSMSSEIPLIPTKLQALLLDQCVFRVEALRAILGNLENLEVLSLAGCAIEELPREVEKLTKLKLLDVSDCTKLKVIPRQVLARLSKLEELKMGNSFDQWDGVEEGNARLAELTELRMLTALEVRIPNFRDSFFPENLERFKIFIGIAKRNQRDYRRPYSWDGNSWNSSFESSKLMKLKLQGARIKSNNSVKKLLKKTEELYLEGLNGVQGLVDELDDEGFQHLKCLHVQNAPDIRCIFNSAGRLLPSHGFPILEVLTLFNLEKMEKICHGLTGAAPFKVLKKIYVDGCHQLKNLFSFSMARQLQLQEITVRDCNNFEEIIDDVEEQGNGIDIVEESEGCKLGGSLRSLALKGLPKLISFNSSNCSNISLFNDKVVFPNLEKLELSRIKINQLWITSSYTVTSQESLNFRKLKSLYISSCSSLEYLFTPPMVSSLVQLEKLNVSFCHNLKQVIMAKGVEEVVNTELIFPRLNSISLGYCYKLSSFYSGSYALKFPSAIKISIEECPNMITFASTFSTEQEKETTYGGIEGCLGKKEPDICSQTFFYDMVDIPLLDDLDLSSIGVQKIWHNQITSMSSFVQNLRKLRVQNCHNLKYLFTSSMVKSLEQLEVLNIWGCKEMQVVILIEELGEKDRTSQTMFPKLDNLQLFNLPQLIRFCSNCDSRGEVYEAQGLNGSGSKVLAATQSNLMETEVTQLVFPQIHITKWPLLKTMYVEQCVKMKIFASEFLSNEKTHEDNHHKRQIQDPMFWISQDSFPCLEQLKISKCHGLENLVSYSTAKSLKQLERMSVTDCDLVEEIVKCLEDNVKDSIVFSQLKSLQLCDLPKLSSFCSRKCDFELPSLKEVTVIGCPQMQYFSLGKTVTKVLQNVQWIDDEEKGHWVSDLNSTIQDLFTQKVGYLGFGYNLRFSDRSYELIEIWKKNPEILTLPFKKLKYLEVRNCSSLSYLLTPSMALSLVQLKDLKVKDCAAMEQVIMVTGVEKVVETDLILFPQLKSLSLESCSKLSNFYVGSNTLKLPMLEKITVKDCLKMIKFASKFSSKKGKETAEGRSEETLVKDIFVEAFFCDEVEIPTLKTLTLSSINIKQIRNNQLSSVSSFAQHLTKLKVVNCSNLKYLFTFSMVKSFVQLEELGISGCEMMEVVILIEGTVKEEQICQAVFPELQTLTLNDLPQLATFYSNCDSLGKISDSERVNIGIGSQKLLATQSTLVETKATKVVFSQVTDLMLRLLPKFKSFFPQSHITEWPSLKRLVLIECHGAQIVASEFLGIEMIDGDNQLERESQPLMFWISKATLPNLEMLVVKWNDNIKIQRGHHPEEYFGKLKVLHLLGFPKQSAFLLPFFFHSLPDLEKLLVKDSFFDEIFQCEEVSDEEKPVCGRTPLRNLRLSKLHELTHLWKEESQLQVDILRNLETLKVQECSRLKNLVPSTAYFDNLQTLVVSECHGLVNLMRYSTAKSLGQLVTMKVANCEMIEEIVVCSGDAVNDGIVFTELMRLQLKGLPRLESFCSGDCDFKFPALREVIITECPNMQIFSKGELSTPELQEVKLTGDVYERWDICESWDKDIDEDMEKRIDDIFNEDEDERSSNFLAYLNKKKDEGSWHGNLNSTIQQLFEEKSAGNCKKGNGENSDHDAKEDDGN